MANKSEVVFKVLIKKDINIGVSQVTHKILKHPTCGLIPNNNGVVNLLYALSTVNFDVVLRLSMYCGSGSVHVLGIRNDRLRSTFHLFLVVSIIGMSAIVVIGNKTHRISGPVVKALLADVKKDGKYRNTRRQKLKHLPFVMRVMQQTFRAAKRKNAAQKSVSGAG